MCLRRTLASITQRTNHLTWCAIGGGGAAGVRVHLFIHSFIHRSNIEESFIVVPFEELSFKEYGHGRSSQAYVYNIHIFTFRTIQIFVKKLHTLLFVVIG